MNPIFSLSGKDREIHDLWIPMERPSLLYAATDQGVWQRGQQDKMFKKIFDPSDSDSRKSLAVVADSQSEYVGTARGIFTRYPSGFQWTPIPGAFASKQINLLRLNEEYLFAAAETELYRITRRNQEWKKVYSLPKTEFLLGDNGSSIDRETKAEKINDLVLNSLVPTRLFLTTSKGIITSQDLGETWQFFPLNGLPQDISALLVKPRDKSSERDQMIAATAKGIFGWEEGDWQPLYKGLTTQNIWDMAWNQQGLLYAATDQGVFVMRPEEPVAAAPLSHHKNSVINPPTLQPVNSTPAPINWQSQFNHEPVIQQVQQMAIQYAEVHPDKIKQWRSSLQKKAWFPSLSVGLDRVSGELFHWDTGANPDNLLTGRNTIDWDVNLSWDLSDLIWNEDQTSIDTRSKLMVELREDIVEEVTRIYFERRRIQVELLNLAETAGEIWIDKNLRLQELTALVDGMTGGEFSQRISKEREIEGSKVPLSAGMKAIIKTKLTVTPSDQ